MTIAVDTDGTGTNIAAVKWAAGNRNVSYFDGAGTTLTGGTFEAADNGTYTVYAIDEAGNERVEEIAIANIVNKAPTIALDYTPKSAAADGVDITVSAAVADDAAGNKIEALKWAAGSLATADFDDPDVGTDVPSSGLFHVSANGNYTVFAADSAGNRQVQSLVIDNIIDSPVTNVPYSNPVVNQASYYLVPGREYTLSIEGLELYVPADAIKQATNVTLKKGDGRSKELAPTRSIDLVRRL
ncbi:hypothetical protein OMP38_19000 [Cohnella ginsengisoli]|uniref:Uncharacterized protein n=1 Tax=Cohnella ginsengisoli TaxID=425004 RepID=A0A9X4KIQ4_9BACL|nr:hypothetical protein [Cohnella ginsengisoli]MDG0792731.1 hypothetical protein [Cohnella ginsengisoli]